MPELRKSITMSLLVSVFLISLLCFEWLTLSSQAFAYPFSKMTYDYPETEKESSKKIDEAINHSTNFKEIIKPMNNDDVLLARQHYFDKFGYSNTTNILTGLITGWSFFDPARLGDLDVFREKLLKDGERVLEFHPCQGCKDRGGESTIKHEWQ